MYPRCVTETKTNDGVERDEKSYTRIDRKLVVLHRVVREVHKGNKSYLVLEVGKIACIQVAHVLLSLLPSLGKKVSSKSRCSVFLGPFFRTESGQRGSFVKFGQVGFDFAHVHFFCNGKGEEERGDPIKWTYYLLLFGLQCRHEETIACANRASNRGNEGSGRSDQNDE